MRSGKALTSPGCLANVVLELLCAHSAQSSDVRSSLSHLMGFLFVCLFAFVLVHRYLVGGIIGEKHKVIVQDGFTDSDSVIPGSVLPLSPFLPLQGLRPHPHPFPFQKLVVSIIAN